MSSSYFKSLDAPSKRTYREKIAVIGGIDPYSLSEVEFETDVSKYPPVSNMDIVNYLIWGKSPFTANHLQAYLSMDVYCQVIEGWVRDVKVFGTESCKLVMAKVCDVFFILDIKNPQIFNVHLDDITPNASPMCLYVLCYLNGIEIVPGTEVIFSMAKVGKIGTHFAFKLLSISSSFLSACYEIRT